MVCDHHEQLEADLAEQNIDLLDFWRGRISLRKIRVLIDGLPFHSRFWTAMAGHDSRWNETDYLLARLIDVQAAAHLQDPERIERPGEAAARERAANARLDKWLERQRRRAAR